MPELDLGLAYADWLRARLTTVDRGQARVLNTPFLDPFNDGINVYIEPKDGGLVLHDNGDTIDHLICLGVKIEDSERRKALIQRAIAGCAVEICGERLQTLANSGNLPQRVHYPVFVLRGDPVSGQQRLPSHCTFNDAEGTTAVQSMEKPMKTPKIPSTDSIQELVRFWDTHDLTDFDDELEEVHESIFERRAEETVTIYLPTVEVEAVKRLAKAKRVGHTALIREWVLEKLHHA